MTLKRGVRVETKANTRLPLLFLTSINIIHKANLIDPKHILFRNK